MYFTLCNVHPEREANWLRIYTVNRKTHSTLFVHNFAKCWLIFTFFHRFSNYIVHE